MLSKFELNDRLVIELPKSDRDLFAYRDMLYASALKREYSFLAIVFCFDRSVRYVICYVVSPLVDCLIGAIFVWGGFRRYFRFDACFCCIRVLWSKVVFLNIFQIFLQKWIRRAFFLPYFDTHHFICEKKILNRGPAGVLKNPKIISGEVLKDFVHNRKRIKTIIVWGVSKVLCEGVHFWKEKNL